MNEIIKRIENAIRELKEKRGVFYFMGFNPTNQPNASSIYTHDLALYLQKNGYDVKIMHDKKYKKPFWLSKEAKNLPHILTDEVVVKPSDFLFIPEVLVSPFFKDLNESGKNLSCEIVVISQTYDFIFQTLDIGMGWSDYKIRNVITTSEKQREFIKNYMSNININIVNPYIHDHFKKPEKPPMPTVALLTRDPSDSEKLVKQFYRRNPHYRWINFKLMSNMSHKDMAKDMEDCFLAVWIDEMSSFGTFPIEAAKMGIPTFAKLPELIPEWAETMIKDEEGNEHPDLLPNVVWYSSKLSLPDAIAGYINQYLTDTINPKLKEAISDLSEKYNYEHFSSQCDATFENLIGDRLKFLEKNREIRLKEEKKEVKESKLETNA